MWTPDQQDSVVLSHTSPAIASPACTTACIIEGRKEGRQPPLSPQAQGTLSRVNFPFNSISANSYL